MDIVMLYYGNIMENNSDMLYHNTDVNICLNCRYCIIGDEDSDGEVETYYCGYNKVKNDSLFVTDIISPTGTCDKYKRIRFAHIRNGSFVGIVYGKDKSILYCKKYKDCFRVINGLWTLGLDGTIDPYSDENDIHTILDIKVVLEEMDDIDYDDACEIIKCHIEKSA